MKIQAGMTSAEKMAVIEWHAKQDMLRAETYGEEKNGVFRGCSIGCVIGGQADYDEHEHWSQLIGAPVGIGRLIDSIFEGLPAKERPAWHVNVHRAVLNAIDRGADLSLIAHHHASQTLNRCLGYIGEGDEPWRVECRRVVEMARDATATGRWLTKEEAALAARLSNKSHSYKAAAATRVAVASFTGNSALLKWTEWAANASFDEIEQERRAQANDLIQLLEQA